MSVIFNIGRDVCVNHRVNFRNVDPASGDIRGDQDILIAILEGIQGTGTLRLIEFATERCGSDSIGGQSFGEFSGIHPTPDKNQHTLATCMKQDIDDGRIHFTTTDAMGDMLDISIGHAEAGSLDMERVFLKPIGQSFDERRKGRRNKMAATILG